MSNSSTTIFTHIPKAGGSTLENILFRKYSKEKIYRLSTKNRKQKIDDIKALDKISGEVKRNFKLITGFVDYGLHTLLPQNTNYITILRDPIERMISYYYFARETKTHELHKLAKETNLAEFVRKGPLYEMENAQTRLISGKDFGLVAGASDPTTQDDFKKALYNLRNEYIVAGILEKYDESLLLMQRILGWKNTMVYRPINVNKKKPKKILLSQKEKRVLEEYNKFDIRLYEHAQLNFSEKIQIEGLPFQIKLKYAKTLNYLYIYHPQVFSYYSSINNKVRKHLYK